ncbi:MAG: hypothetical protein NC307_10110 [Roseburia sp.]|nr:hypothetical protein [Roseburia sp.]
MLERLGKNLIFFVTPYLDDKLAVEAYDFYLFLKLRIIFDNYEKSLEREKEKKTVAEESIVDNEWKLKELKQKLAEAYELIELARDENDKAHYYESEKLLLKARRIKEKLLGQEHLELAERFS